MSAMLFTHLYMDATLRVVAVADADGLTLMRPSKVIICTQCACLMNVDFMQYRIWNQLTILYRSNLCNS